MAFDEALGGGWWCRRLVGAYRNGLEKGDMKHWVDVQGSWKAETDCRRVNNFVHRV